MFYAQSVKSKKLSTPKKGPEWNNAAYEIINKKEES